MTSLLTSCGRTEMAADFSLRRMRRRFTGSSLDVSTNTSEPAAAIINTQITASSIIQNVQKAQQKSIRVTTNDGWCLAPFKNIIRIPSSVLKGKGKGPCIALYELETHHRTTERHLPYGITQCYLPPDTGERAPP